MFCPKTYFQNNHRPEKFQTCWLYLQKYNTILFLARKVNALSTKYFEHFKKNIKDFIWSVFRTLTLPYLES